MSDWFARTFPTLARYPADKWAMIPFAFIVTVGVLMGALLPFFEVQQDCDPCHDVMMKRYDAYLCGNKHELTDGDLDECRRKLGKPEIY